MKHIYRIDDEWMELITQCRCSSLRDDLWCRDHDHGIPASTLYHHVKILCQKAYDVPAPVKGNTSQKQEAVPLQVTDIQNPDRIENSFSMPGNMIQDPTISIHMRSVYIDIMNHTDTTLLSAAVMALKTLC